MLEEFRAYLVALAIGLLIGIERERTKGRRSSADVYMGVRTFTIIALLGAMAAHLSSDLIGGVIAVFVTVIIAASYINRTLGEKGRRYGVTTEFTGMAVFTLGYLADTDARMAIIIAVLLLVLLSVKERMSQFVTTGFEEREMSAATKFLVIAFVVLPLLPDHAIDPWGVIMPAKMWLLFVVIAGVEFFSYIILRRMGQRWGFAMTGFLGGLASATAASLTLASRAKGRGDTVMMATISGLVLAEVASLFTQLLLVLGLAPEFITQLGPLLIAPIIVGLMCVLIIHHLSEKAEIPPDLQTDIGNPLTLRRTFKLALTLSSAIIIVHLAALIFQEDGVYLTALFGGTISVRAVVLALSDLATKSAVSVQVVGFSMILAFIANIATKVLLISRAGSARLIIHALPVLLLMLLSSVLAFWCAPQDIMNALLQAIPPQPAVN